MRLLFCYLYYCQIALLFQGVSTVGRPTLHIDKNVKEVIMNWDENVYIYDILPVGSKNNLL